MSASQSELVAAKHEYSELIADTKSAIGNTAMYHAAALGDKFGLLNPTTIRLHGPSTAETFTWIPTKEVRQRVALPRPLPRFPAQVEGGELGFCQASLLTHQRQLTLYSLGHLTVKLPAADRFLELECNAGDGLRINSTVSLSQKGTVNTECGIITRPRREDGDLTNNTDYTSSFSGYRSPEALVEDYSQSYRSALAVAKLLDDELGLLHGEPSGNNDMLRSLSELWFEASPTPAETPASVLHQISTFRPL